MGTVQDGTAVGPKLHSIIVDPRDLAVLRAIIAMAQSLKLGIIAEGVENQRQLDFLAHEGCHIYQGYLFSKPVPLDEFSALLGG